MNLRTFFQNNLVASGTIKIFASMMLLLPSGLVTAGILTRTLGPADYGTFTIAVAIVLWFQQFSMRPFGRATIKFVAESNDWRQESIAILRVQLMFSLLMAFIFILSAPLWELLLDRPKLAFYLLLFAIDIPLFSSSVVHGSVLMSQGDFGKRAQMHVARWMGRMIFVIVFVQISPTIEAGILGYVCASIVEFAVARRFMPLPILKPATFRGLHFSTYALPIAVVLISTEIFVRLDLLFVEAYSHNSESAGFYAAAQNLTLIPTLFAIALAPTLQVALSKNLKNEQWETARTLTQTTLRILFYMLPFAVLVMGTSKNIMVFVYGDEFVAGYPILQTLILGAIGVAFCSVFVSIFIAIGRPFLAMMLWFPVVPLAVVGHIFTIPQGDALGAALVTTTMAWVSALTMFAAVLQYWKLPLPFATIARTVAISGIVYVFSSAWQAEGLALMVQGVLGGILILLIYALLQEWPLLQFIKQNRLAQQG